MRHFSGSLDAQYYRVSACARISAILKMSFIWCIDIGSRKREREKDGERLSGACMHARCGRMLEISCARPQLALGISPFPRCCARTASIYSLLVVAGEMGMGFFLRDLL